MDGLSGLAEIMLGRHGGAADLADLADSLGLEVDDLLPLVDALVLLGFAELHADRLELSAAGRVFAGASIQQSKEIFARACLSYAPLVRTIYRALSGSLDGTLPIGFFTDILRPSFSEEDAAAQLEIAADWGRYAELYAYDAARGVVIREDHGIGAALAAGDDGALARPGTLSVYLGAAPGSGKTFTMLREGRELRSQGADVVIGAVATRGRPRTAEAVGGLETVPASPDGSMDTAAVLARRPDVALVDDLGGNAGGIAALRAAGIDVISTADVADVQAAAAAAAAITGQAAATVPDEVLAGADEVQFVDNSPEALRSRLRHGNIYPPDQARAALAGEFQVPRLAALRELGLRLVAGTLSAAASRPAPRSRPPRHGPASRRTCWSRWSARTGRAPWSGAASGWPGAAARAARSCCSARPGPARRRPGSSATWARTSRRPRWRADRPRSSRRRSARRARATSCWPPRRGPRWTGCAAPPSSGC